MMKFKNYLTSLVFFFLSCQAYGCQIHERNQAIFSEVVKSRLEKSGNTTSLFNDIDLIGKEALQKGLDLSCYTYRLDPKTQSLCYASSSLWEGKEKYDVVFLLFIWPSQEEALKCCKDNIFYETCIHSHPIPCAYTVMLEEITERRYSRIDLCDRRIRYCGKEVFHLGEKAVDLNQNSFIHQLLFEGTGCSPAITLHVYGCSSVEHLSRIFAESRDHHVYHESFVVEDQ